MCLALREEEIDVSSTRYAETLLFASVAFAFQTTPIAYLSSLFFSDDVSSFATQAASSFSVAVLSFIASVVLNGLALAGEDVSVVWDVVSVLFCASPQYSFARIFYNLSRREHAIPRFEEKREEEEEEEEVHQHFLTIVTAVTLFNIQDGEEWLKIFRFLRIFFLKI